MLFFLKKKPAPPVMKMIVHGRRALGEQWQEITLRPRSDGGLDVESVAVQAPPASRPVMIPAMANLSNEECNFILEGALKTQEYYKRHHKRPTEEEIQKHVQKLWDEWVAQKLAYFKGVSQFGPAGKTQRQKPALTHWN